MLDPKNFYVAVATGVCVLIAAPASWADPPSVKVDLSDKNGKVVIVLSSDKAKAGTVEFVIKNTSDKTMHEFLITSWKGSVTSLPFDDKGNEVDEDQLPDLMGSEDMKPGAEATILVPMKPGEYVFFSNETGDYKAGMERRFTVTR